MKLRKGYSGNTRVIGIAILGLLIIGMILTPVASMNTQSTNEVISAAQACEVSGLHENTVISSTDARVREFLETDWREDMPELDEIQRTNSSQIQDSKEGYEIPPLVPGESIPESMNMTLKPITVESINTSGKRTNYFPGHTWASSYGPDDVDTEAVPVTPAAEGHWFPKESYARIQYYAFLQPGMKLHLRVERDKDTFSRRFRVFVSSVKVLDRVITNSWEGDIQLGYWGMFVITLEIHYGGYRDKGWQLRYYHLFDSEDQPYDTQMEFFRKKSASELVYRFPMGPNTKLHIESANHHDPYNRYIYIYIDNNYWCRINSPGAFVIDLPDFSTPGMHEIKFLLYYGGYTDYGKGLKHWWVNYEYRRIEVDWMEGWYQGDYYDHSQPQEVFDFVETYYIIHDYRRVEFHIGSSVGFEYRIESSYDFEQNYYLNPDRFNHYGQSRWSYGLFAHYIDPPNWGHGFKNKWFYIGDQSSDTMDKRKWVLLHEFGHLEGMYDISGGTYDVYGTIRLFNDPWYCCYSWETEHLAWVRAWW